MKRCVVRAGLSAGCCVGLVGWAGAAGAQLPGDVSGYEVLARGVFDGPGYMLPPESQVTNITPRINNNGDVAFAYFDLNIDKVIWYNGSSVTVPFFSTSDPNLNDDGLVVWRVSTLDADPLKWGVWTYDPSTGVAERLTTNPLGASGWGTPTINNAGVIATRAEFSLNDAIGYYTGTAFNPIAVDDSLPFTFLNSTIGLNESLQISCRGNRASDPDGVFVFESDGSFAASVLEGDVTPTGDTVTGFLNGTDINNSGRVAVNTFTSAGDEMIGVDSDGTITVYADEDDGVVSDIAFFNPRINNDGWIVFRANNASGQQAVFVGDGTGLPGGLLEIASVGTQVDTDAGPGVITGFSGGVDINDAGQALVNAALETSQGVSLGRAIIRVDIVGDEPCEADVNGDGLLTPADFSAWVQAFNAQGPGCDQNGDELCTPQDFSAWIQNFNAGCD